MVPYRTTEKKRRKLNRWRASNPEKVKAQWDRQKPNKQRYYQANVGKFRDDSLRRKYGLTYANYNQLLSEQNGECAICGRSSCPTGKRFAVDHDHDTNQIRGLLCQQCNNGLGCLQDDISILEKAIAYLRRYHE